MSKFDLEHWKSRAAIAEKERDSARAVLASLRHHFHLGNDIGNVRERLRKHDQEWWTRDHAINAVAEAVSGIADQDDELPTPGEGKP